MFSVRHATDEKGNLLTQDPPIAQFLFSNGRAAWIGWYPWFAKLIVVGERAVGGGLIVGVLAGIAAFFGAVLNMSFLMAGSVATNPVLFCAAILLMLAWKNAGDIGLDRYLVPARGTPWRQPAHAPAATSKTATRTM
jgi:glutamate-1-semialdehyde aminotransferase